MYKNSATLADIPLTRIEADTTRVKEMAQRIDQVTDRIVNYARQMGYFDPPKEGGTAPEPVVLTLSDALTDLERKLERLEGSLVLFQ